MAKLKNIYVIQKFVSATSLSDALKNEKKGKIVNITLTIAEPNRALVNAVGFGITPDGREELDYEEK